MTASSSAPIGVIVVDTKTTVDSEKEVIAEIAKITPKPVTTAIITHSDGDHVNGLAAFPDGITVIAQENCKKEMEASASSRNPAPQNRLPSKTYDKTDKLTIDGVHIRLYHWAPGHTSGDTVVYLPDQKIVFGGDLLVTNRPDTLIHLEKNGSAAGWIENAKGMLGLDADTYLTGHGNMMTKADVQKKLDFIQGKYNQIKTMAAQGKSLDEIKTSFGESTAAPQPGPNGAAACGHAHRSDLQGSVEEELRTIVVLGAGQPNRPSQSKPFSRFVQLLEGPALDAGGSRRLDVADGKLAKIGGWTFTRGKAQAAFHSPRKPLVDNPESVFRRDGRQSCVVAKNLVDAVLADEREQALMDIPELDLGRVLLPNHDDAVIGFIVDDGADRVVPKIL